MEQRLDSRDSRILEVAGGVADRSKMVRGCQTYDSLTAHPCRVASSSIFICFFTCTRITVDTKDDSISNVFSVCGGVVVYI